MTHKDFNGYKLQDVAIKDIRIPDYQRDPERAEHGHRRLQ